MTKISREIYESCCELQSPTHDEIDKSTSKKNSRFLKLKQKLICLLVEMTSLYNIHGDSMKIVWEEKISSLKRAAKMKVDQKEISPFLSFSQRQRHNNTKKMREKHIKIKKININ